MPFDVNMGDASFLHWLPHTAQHKHHVHDDFQHSVESEDLLAPQHNDVSVCLSSATLVLKKLARKLKTMQ